MPQRRFSAEPETILRDLRIVLGKMSAGDVAIQLGGRMSKGMTRL